MSDSGDSLITEVLRASNMDPSGRSAAPHMLINPQSQARWVQQVLAHMPSRDKAECPSYWPCMESSQKRRVSEMEVDHLVWAPTAEATREWVTLAASRVTGVAKARHRVATLSAAEVIGRMDELATLLNAVAMYAPPHQDDQAAVLRGLAVVLENDCRRGKLGSWTNREQNTLPYLWSAATNLRCLCLERERPLERAEWLDSVIAGIWHQGLPCQEQQSMAQPMPHEVLDAMDHAELELKGYHSKCYRGLRARGDDLLRYIDQGFASKQSSLETAEEDEVSVLSEEPQKRPRRVVHDDARKSTAERRRTAGRRPGSAGAHLVQARVLGRPGPSTSCWYPFTPIPSRRCAR
jgi:hypothetical protein